jgi:death-on-curing protein
MTALLFLGIEDVLHIHDRVCRDFAHTDDPVDTPGPSDVGLLESAIARQWIGAGDWLKYDSVWSNAATLTFGLCCNHAFHNGNKRTALICMIAHLERNGHSLFGTKHAELYGMIKDVARHRLGVKDEPRRRRQPPAAATRRATDEEVADIARWLRKRARRIEHDERRITHRQLRKILGQHDLELRDPKNNAIAVCRRRQKRKGLLRTVTVYERVCSIGYRGDGQLVSLRDIKTLRRECRLDEANGYDSQAFYKSDDPVDIWINDYRSVLERLSKE